MTQALFKPIKVQEFLEWIPKNSDKRYELHNGAIVEMSQPTGEHEDVTGFLNIEISSEVKRLKLPYSVPKTALVQSATSDSAYSPDILVLNKPALKSEELWAKYSTVQSGASIPLVVEVVSTNWRDDYYKKMGEYEEIKILEYWIVDYLGLGGIKYIGSPKRATLSIYNLVDDEYQVIQFRGDDHIISTAFPELNLTAQQIFNATL
ncbi:MAG: Uma2 family endonuclease [Cyanomargarita calcarea GSE-NOS-MK-12-04C]|jgi:Uma2 family endonuclease|uniref:Uma2 family endonuclease n=1 Tax=Cyanomargarita calcarea GSE-NOS-MK-12-04C TaxID=2839659 RepID=A0A951UV93_9CYAN|nr:Uma2 family endonuclease [Cyanomargarita calcarea GSE-NOS-MK-12-04C]